VKIYVYVYIQYFSIFILSYIIHTVEHEITSKIPTIMRKMWFNNFTCLRKYFYYILELTILL